MGSVMTQCYNGPKCKVMNDIVCMTQWVIRTLTFSSITGANNAVMGENRHHIIDMLRRRECPVLYSYKSMFEVTVANVKRFLPPKFLNTPYYTDYSCIIFQQKTTLTSPYIYLCSPLIKNPPVGILKYVYQRTA